MFLRIIYLGYHSKTLKKDNNNYMLTRLLASGNCVQPKKKIMQLLMQEGSSFGIRLYNKVYHDS